MPSLKYSKPPRLIMIGSSTGGPGHIKKVLSSLKHDFFDTLVIAQHMGNEFIPSFIKQLDAICPYDVVPATSGTRLLSSKIYVSSLATSISQHSGEMVFQQVVNDNMGYNPDINHLFISAAQLTCQLKVVAIILTGIGDDGVLGCKVLSERGALCIAESEESAIVDGMPMQARRQVKKISVLSLDEIINIINQ